MVIPKVHQVWNAVPLRVQNLINNNSQHLYVGQITHLTDAMINLLWANIRNHKQGQELIYLIKYVCKTKTPWCGAQQLSREPMNWRAFFVWSL